MEVSLPIATPGILESEMREVLTQSQEVNDLLAGLESRRILTLSIQSFFSDVRRDIHLLHTAIIPVEGCARLMSVFDTSSGDERGT